ncbi:Cysteine sulfinate desulfinase [Paramixta manurensis]|uniref:cysteine desulfurase n=1 Tax=Paramixta manurensis TaxID=2740817 RepID=A0A6M8UEZ7_9GAMM|nr:Cysteine sulfinate desulfinase [Erwiniaceae bacterium PD-1]
MKQNFDNHHFREQFPAIKNIGMVYLDSAATALKPQVMIDTINDYFANNGATVHRSLHQTGKETTEQYEAARYKCASLINSPAVENVIWTRGATESINMIAYGYLQHAIKDGDEIIINDAEHHSNLIPWLMVAKIKGAKIVRLPLRENGTIDVQCLDTLISAKTKFIALTQMSNVTGFMPDIQAVIEKAHRKGVKVAVDGAQGAAHSPLDVIASGIDFYVLSAHKMYGPTGVGVLYYSPNIADEFFPVYGGGQMLSTLEGETIIPKKSPFKYEAGTPNIAGILGFGAVLDWLKNYDMEVLKNHSKQLVDIIDRELQSTVPGYIRYSQPGSSILSFNISGLHHVDFSTLLSEFGISIRSGKHCAIPLMKHFGISGTLRASLAPYNNESDAFHFIDAIKQTLKILRP